MFKRGKAHRFALIAILIMALLLVSACQNGPDVAGSDEDDESTAQETQESQTPTAESDDSDVLRQTHRDEMVQRQIVQRGVEDEDVLAAMRKVPRHRYVPDEMKARAYEDSPLPIGFDQTISQPYIVALMTDLLDVSPGQKVLEIGTGSGYQAAVLAEMGVKVYSIEIICELAERAERDLKDTGYGDVEVMCGDGYKGWPEHAPFDRIIVTAAPPQLPDALVEQLAVGGKLVVPVGEHSQMLQVVTKISDDEIEVTDTLPVRFVPMVPGAD